MATDAEIQAAIASDPWGYHMATLERSNVNLDRVSEAAKVASQTFVSNYIGGLIEAIKLHSMELAIFRTIESKVANPTTTREELDQLFEKLQEFRAAARKKAEAAASVDSATK